MGNGMSDQRSLTQVTHRRAQYHHPHLNHATDQEPVLKDTSRSRVKRLLQPSHLKHKLILSVRRHSEAGTVNSSSADSTPEYTTTLEQARSIHTVEEGEISSSSLTPDALPSMKETFDVAEDDKAVERQRRAQVAERILEEIAHEFAAKRAAGLVPSIPKPAATLLWEERAQKERMKVGARGHCVFGRDTDSVCGCTDYEKIKGKWNTGGVCEGCNHGAVWHKLSGGANLQSTTSSRSSDMMKRHYSLHVEEEEKEPEEEEDELMSDLEDELSMNESSDEDEDIANEIARPFSQVAETRVGSDLSEMSPQSIDRSSLFSNDTGFEGKNGTKTNVRSDVNRDVNLLLATIQQYRDAGYSERQIEERIRHEFHRKF